MNSGNQSIAALKQFSLVAFAEGVSFLVLMFVAMPLKYAAGMPWAVKYTGWAHGVLFIAYFASLAHVKFKLDWGFGKLIGATLASLLPFGTFIFEKKVVQPELQRLQTPS